MSINIDQLICIIEDLYDYFKNNINEINLQDYLKSKKIDSLLNFLGVSELSNQDFIYFKTLFKHLFNKSQKKCLIIIDIQNDFLTGSMATNDNWKLKILDINSLIKSKGSEFELIIYTKDWHPKDHISFYSNYKLYSNQNNIINMYDKINFTLPKKYNNKILSQSLFPNHCVKYTKGADFPNELFIDKILFPQTHIIYKGKDKYLEAFSPFYDTLNLKRGNIIELLFNHNITDVFICGCVLEYCVKFTALDSYDFLFSTFIISSSTICLNPKNKYQEEEYLKSRNIKIIDSSYFKNI